MKLSPTSLSEMMKHFFDGYIEQYQEKHGHLPLIDIDEDWPSPCLQHTHNDNDIFWRPIKISEPLSFDNVALALEFNLHADIQTYFTTYYSESINATCSEGALSLLLPWSSKDFKRLQENIIGHILMKKRLKQPITIFFAVTDDEENILSINNDTGEVWVERVGCLPHKKLSNSLSDFFQKISPDV
ncbi:MAG: SecY interacting protein Syd [Alteromonadaceae bacterium]|jgi:SecY interacting protein Syd